MKKNALNAASLAIADWTERDWQRVCFLNAEPLPDLDSHLKEKLICEQGNRPSFLALEKLGYNAIPIIESEERFSASLVLAGRNRKVNEANLSRTWNMTKPGGLVVVAGGKTEGIASLRKTASGKTQIAESFSKFHSVVFTLQRNNVALDIPDLSRRIDGYDVSAGMFSADGPDKGSVLLTQYFNERIKGRVADLGSGWGYLSAELLKCSSEVEAIDLFEADYLSLSAARKNLQVSDRETTFQWCDVTTEFPKRPYHWVIMNPPFHSGRAAEPELGQRFISTAASTLPNGGRLLMVANRNLPYEANLNRLFRSVQILGEEQGFKVFEAVK
ncbi:MAG: class I SAM-dependent methyltransferase [Pseudomonadota bacterium]